MSNLRFFLGTYTSSGGAGIYQGTLEQKTGQLTLSPETMFVENPSFLAVHPSKKYLFCVNEIERGAISAFAIQQDTGKLEFLNSQSSQGAHPCHLSIHPSGDYCLAANYSSGNIVSLPILAEGQLAQTRGFVQYAGSGPNFLRQTKSHAHFVTVLANNEVFVADLGSDQIWLAELDSKTGSLVKKEPASLSGQPGSGPRHLAFHPTAKFLYVINELNSTISVFQARAGEFREIETKSTLPQGYAGENTGAHIAIHPSGKWLYASNRGHDSIVFFAIKPNGKLEEQGHQPIGGETPRHFSLDKKGRFLLVCNQTSGNVVAFKIDPATGSPTPTGQSCQVPAPVCAVIL